MKFWELTSAFRNEPNILNQVLGQDKWTKYYNQYKRLDEIVLKQERHILDEELPFDLCYEITEKSKQEFWLSFKEQPQVLYSYRPDIEDLERLLPSEILTRFGGDKIEDAHERCSTDVQPKPLKGNVEVIDSFNLTSLGLLSILRTEKNILPDNCILSTLDEINRWKVKHEFKQLFIDPYSAYEKVEAQKKQNIRQYLLSSIENDEKPKAGEFLKIIENFT
jgi:hypothetical protein